MLETEKFIDPLRSGHFRDFSSLRLPVFDRTRLNVDNVDRITDIFPDPLNLRDKLRPLNLLWVGITGDLMPRFGLPSFLNLFEAIPGLENNLKIYGVGSRDVELGQPLVQGLQERGLPLANYSKFADLLPVIRDGTLHIDGVFIASLPCDHYEHCRLAIEATRGESFIFCEKPLVVPSELEKMRALASANNDLIVPIDFFATATPLYYLMTTARGQEIISRIGQPKVINGSLVETQPVEHQRLSGNFGLLNIERSGGGIMLDCAVHSLVMALIYRTDGGRRSLDDQQSSSFHAPHTYLDQRSIDSTLGSGSGVLLENLRETGGVLSRFYNGKAACVVNAQGAKGVAHDAYLLDVLTDKGYRLIIGVGTDFQPPYFSVTSPDGKTEMMTFDTPQKEVGYGGAFYDMIAHMLLGKTADVLPSSSAMFEASTDAVADLARVNDIPVSSFGRHSLGTMHESAIPIPLEIQEIVPRTNRQRR